VDALSVAVGVVVVGTRWRRRRCWRLLGLLRREDGSDGREGGSDAEGGYEGEL
jgi:hypothetical protein